MNSIVIVDKNWGIGRDNDLLVHLPSDLSYFKEKTLGKVIVIGRNTLESFPNQKPLPNRTNIVLTRNKNFKNDSVIICNSVEELNEELKKYKSEDIFISGGENIYNQFVGQCDSVYVTKMDEVFEADKHFENLDENQDFHLAWQGDTIEENGVTFTFFRYDKIK